MAKKWRGLAVRHLLQDDVLGDDADTADACVCLAGLTQRPEVLAVEAASPRQTRMGGSITTVTLVTASTEA